jgi:hypothetical protein
MTDTTNTDTPDTYTTGMTVAPSKLDSMFTLLGDALGFDDENYLIDTETGERVMATDGDPVTRNDIGYLGPADDGSIDIVRDDTSQIVAYLSDRDIRK